MNALPGITNWVRDDADQMPDKFKRRPFETGALVVSKGMAKSSIKSKMSESQQ